MKMATTMRTRVVEAFRTQSLLGYLREFVNSPQKSACHTDTERTTRLRGAVQMLPKETNCASDSICYIGFSLPAGSAGQWSSGSHAAEFIICELEANIHIMGFLLDAVPQSSARFS
jgi:hypothetical protein